MLAKIHKAVVKGAVLGAIAGVASPIALAVGNEMLFAHNNHRDITAARICFAERNWVLLRLEVKHAKGCRNGFLDSIPFCLVVGMLGGSLIGALCLVSKGIGISSSTTSDAEPATPSPIPPSQVVASTPEPTPKPVATHHNDIQKPSLRSISPQIADGVQRFKGLDWNTIGKGAAISGVVAVIGVGAVNLLEGGGSSGGGGNPFRKREQRQYYVLDGYSDA